MLLLPPPLDYWYTSFFFLAAPGPLHELAVSARSRSSLARANKVYIPISSRTPPVYLLSVPLLSTRFVALAFPLALSFLLLLSCTPQTSLWTVSLLGFLYIHPYVLDYVIPPYSSLPFLLSPIQPYQLWLATSFLACFLLYIVISTFSRLLFVLCGYIPISSLITVLLVVLAHPINSTFFSYCKLYFQLFYLFRVPFPCFCIFWLWYDHITHNTYPSVEL